MGVAAKALLRNARRSHLRGLAKPVECRTGYGPRAHRCYRPALRPHTMSITRFNTPFRSQVPPQCRGACVTVAGGGPNRATAIVVARLVFTISGQSRAFTALRLIDIVTAVHSHLNELATLEFGLQQLARLEDELAPDGALPGRLCWRSPPERALARSSERMRLPRRRCRVRRNGASRSSRSRSRPAIAGRTDNGRRAVRWLG